jgi:hypothetical protein
VQPLGPERQEAREGTGEVEERVKVRVKANGLNVCVAEQSTARRRLAEVVFEGHGKLGHVTFPVHSGQVSRTKLVPSPMHARGFS